MPLIFLYNISYLCNKGYKLYIIFMTMINRNMCIYRIQFFLFYLLFLMMLQAVSSRAYAQGIRFTGSDEPIEGRTSVAFFSDAVPAFHQAFAINFDLQLPNNNTIGYIVRIKEKNQGSIFNLHYDREEGKAVFRLNEEGKTSLITMRIPL